MRENGTDEIIALIDKADITGAAILTSVEMTAAIAKTVRQKWVEKEIALEAWGDFSEHWKSYTRLPVTPSLLEQAARLAWEYGLRDCDSLHLASALAWQEKTDEPVFFVTFDRELWIAAGKAGMQVLPEGLYS